MSIASELKRDRRDPPGNWASAFRMYLSISVCITCIVPFNAPTSIQRAIFNIDGNDLGWFILIFMCTLGVLGTADAAIELCPRKWRLVFAWGRHNRHLIFMFMALGASIVSFINYYEGIVFANMMRYVFDTVACMIVAVLDVTGRFMQVHRKTVSCLH